MTEAPRLSSKAPRASAALPSLGGYAVLILSAALLTACSHEKPISETDAAGELPVGVPREARIVRMGRADSVGLLSLANLSSDREMIFRSKNDGTIWVIQRSNGRTLYKGRVKATDKLAVNTQSHYIAINDGFVYEAPLMEDEEFLVYFAPRPPSTSPATKPSS